MLLFSANHHVSPINVEFLFKTKSPTICDDFLIIIMDTKSKLIEIIKSICHNILL